MRIHGKVAAIAVCFGVFLLLYLWGGNAADGPLLKEVAEDEKAAAADGNSATPPPLPQQQQQQGQQGQRRDVAAKLARKQPAVGVRTEELLKRRKEGKAANLGVGVRAKR